MSCFFLSANRRTAKIEIVHCSVEWAKCVIRWIKSKYAHETTTDSKSVCVCVMQLQLRNFTCVQRLERRAFNVFKYTAITSTNVLSQWLWQRRHWIQSTQYTVFFMSYLYFYKVESNESIVRCIQFQPYFFLRSPNIISMHRYAVWMAQNFKPYPLFFLSITFKIICTIFQRLYSRGIKIKKRLNTWIAVYDTMLQ